MVPATKKTISITLRCRDAATNGSPRTTLAVEWMFVYASRVARPPRPARLPLGSCRLTTRRGDSHGIDRGRHGRGGPHSQKLPFDNARHLRNSSNGNKEVKVGRDGQEIDGPVGAQLLALFHASNERYSSDGGPNAPVQDDVRHRPCRLPCPRRALAGNQGALSHADGRHPCSRAWALDRAVVASPAACPWTAATRAPARC